MIPRRRIDLRLREAWQAGAIDMPDRAPGPTIDKHHCPLCRGPVYAPDDSHAERIDCSSCGAVLVTRRDLAGLVSVELLEGDAKVVGLLAEMPTNEPDPNWQARVLAACDAIDKERS